MPAANYPALPQITLPAKKYPACINDCLQQITLSLFKSVICIICCTILVSEQCCKPHDECIDSAWNAMYRVERNAATTECDTNFKECIWRLFQSQGPYCRSMIYVTHAKVTEYYNQMCAILGNIFC